MTRPYRKSAEWQAARERRFAATAMPEPQRLSLADLQTLPEPQRFSLADLQTMGVWLVGEMSKRWPMVSERQWISKIHNWISMNDVLFLRCADAVLLAFLVRDDMDGHLRVEMKFNFGGHAACELMATRMLEWAESHGAKDVRLAAA